MSEFTALVDALFPEPVDSVYFNEASEAKLSEPDSWPKEISCVSPMTPKGVAFLFGVQDDVEDDVYLFSKLPPHAVLYRDGTMILCWVLDRLYDIWEVEDVAKALGMMSLEESVPAPGIDGWRLLHTDLESPLCTPEELFRIYGSEEEIAEPPPAPASTQDAMYGDAKVLRLYNDSDAKYAKEIVVSIGRNREAKQWNPTAMPLGAFIAQLAKHREGPKDGLAVVLGDMVPGPRGKNAVKTMEAIGLDFDVGTPSKVIDAAVGKLGCLAVRYTTHSHLKTKTDFRKDEIVRWSRDNAGGAEIDDELIQRYLAEKKGWEPGIVKSASYIGDNHEHAGIMVRITHDPMPKNRVIVPLRTPYVIAEQDGTQADAVKRWRKVPTALAAKLGLPLDESCLDTSRLFFLPRHAAGSPFEAAIWGGELLDWKSLEIDDPYAEIADKLDKKSGGSKSQTKKGKELGSWSVQKAHGFLICQAVEDHAPDKIRHRVSAGLEIECPNDGAHSNAGDPEDRACLIANPGEGMGDLFVIKCQHESCRKMTNLDMLGLMIEDGWLPEDIIRDESYNVSDTESAPNPEAAKRAETKEKAKDGYQDALDTITEDTSELEIREAVGMAVSAGLSNFELDKIAERLSKKLKVGMSTAKALIKSVQTEQAAERKTTIEDPLGRRIFTYNGEFHFDEAFNACFRSLLQENRDAGEPVFCCVDSRPVRLTRTKEGRITFEELAARTMWSELNTRITFVRESDNGVVGMRGQVPQDVANHVFEQAWTKLPQAPEIVYTPLFVPDANGSAMLISEPGWYKAPIDLIMADTGFTVPPVPRHAQAWEVEEALNFLLEEVLGDFPFLDFDTKGVERSEPSQANALAMLITPFMRRLLNSPTPVFFISKPVPGTGGTLLGTVPIILFDGDDPTPEPYTQNEEEMRKSLLASIMTTRSHLFFDDVREFNNRVLLQAITSKNIGGRLLGATKTVERPNRFNWIATGNNPNLGTEMQRRAVNVRLVRFVEDVQTVVYSKPNYPEWLKEHRAETVHAILTLIQHWIDMGMPLFKERKRATFEDWSMKVGGVLQACGIEGFLDNGKSPTADMEEVAIKTFVSAWLVRHGKDNPLTMPELFAFAIDGEFDIADGNNEDMKKSRFKNRLPMLNGRMFTFNHRKYVVRCKQNDDHINVYTLEEHVDEAV